MALNEQIAQSLYTQPGQKKALSAPAQQSQQPTYDWSKGQVFDPRTSPYFGQTNNGEVGTSQLGAGDGSDYRNLWAGIPGMEAFNSTPQNAASRAAGERQGISAEDMATALANNGYTWKRANENELTGSSMNHPGYYDWLEGANGQLVGERRFTPDTSVGDMQAWIRMGGQALTAGLMNGSDTAVSGMDLAADGGNNALWQTGGSGMDLAGDGGINAYGTTTNPSVGTVEPSSDWGTTWEVDPNQQYNVTNTGEVPNASQSPPERGVYEELGPDGTPVSVNTNTYAGDMPTENPLSGIADFAKQNPQLTATLGSAAVGAINSANGPDMPTIPNAGSPGGTSNQALIDALTQKLYGTGGAQAGDIDYSSVNPLVTNAGNTSQYYQQAADAMYDKQKQYLDPQIAQQKSQLEARLAEQGFVPGTPGYNQAMTNFMDTNNRAYAAARDSAIAQGVTAGQNLFNNEKSNADLNNSASREALAQVLARRNQPLNELASLKSGEQIQYQNGIDQYNAKVASQNSNNQLIGQLGTALAMYYSDARLKDDIVPIGQTPGGINVYEYTIFGRRETGVIAQELQQILPSAVSVDPDSGYLMVDYSKVR